MAIVIWHVFCIWYCIGFEHNTYIEFEERAISEDSAFNLLQVDARMRHSGAEQGVQSHSVMHVHDLEDGDSHEDSILRMVMDLRNVTGSVLANSLSKIIGTMGGPKASQLQIKAKSQEGSSSSSGIFLLVTMLALPLVLIAFFGVFLYYPEKDAYLAAALQRRPGGAQPMASPISSFANTPVPAGGQVLGIPKMFMPVAQEANVKVMDYLNHRVLYQALISEKGFEPGIWLTTNDGIPVAFLDTKHALMDATDPHATVRNATGRRVILHRISQNGIMKTSGGGVTADIGEPYAVFVLNTHTGGGALIGQRVGLSSSSTFLLAVYLDAQGKITSVKDGSGNLFARTDTRENGELLDKWQRHDPGSLVLSLVPRADSDTVVILSAVMAVLKMHPYFAF